MKIGFWKPAERYGEFSNWHKCKFVYNGIRFTSSEQALMYMKAITFEDYDTANEILSTNNPYDIKMLGRKVNNYKEDTWTAIRYNIMVDILVCKFSQNENLKNLLLSTEDHLLYEASPFDNVWGIGSNDTNIIKGTNLLGKALMEVRSSLK